MTSPARTYPDVPGTARALSACTLAAIAAAPLGGAVGGLLCAAIVTAVNLGRSSPRETFDPGMVAYGLSVGAWPVALAAPAAVLAAHLLARGLSRPRYGMALGWSGFLVGGIAPYLAVPGYDALPLGLVAGMASAWAFARVGGVVRDAA